MMQEAMDTWLCSYAQSQEAFLWVVYSLPNLCEEYKENLVYTHTKEAAMP